MIKKLSLFSLICFIFASQTSVKAASIFLEEENKLAPTSEQGILYLEAARAKFDEQNYAHAVSYYSMLNVKLLPSDDLKNVGFAAKMVMKGRQESQKVLDNNNRILAKNYLMMNDYERAQSVYAKIDKNNLSSKELEFLRCPDAQIADKIIRSKNVTFQD